ncbi:hypothetical protein BU16DRAFT_568460 [Lophium mytilinum]|uniref:Uncharacterized protein n=1 Tax=Lophium mytilinum TaxID=390894 RepID=A0A6A6Q771_9PEZI|nr:hypothetical protein BU16DRAFT_568460 [Lophium mytilinum]
MQTRNRNRIVSSRQVNEVIHPIAETRLPQEKEGNVSSGHDGGASASRWTGIKCSGLPLGLELAILMAIPEPSNGCVLYRSDTAVSHHMAFQGMPPKMLDLKNLELNDPFWHGRLGAIEDAEPSTSFRASFWPMDLSTTPYNGGQRGGFIVQNHDLQLVSQILKLDRSCSLVPNNIRGR